ncbi:glycosyltransferase family 2 protein [Patescibacteria group bacterium]|nr:glycosyltransferase family 2 protein [Patescibacteria group bacterium]MBU0777345.1 glycosyltransferase family 2 protein [Patescibacteria group bacterium]MBU0845973.1 glycosyltransferase family 2 protein [Patescibacteria group bacterium]MBU0922521.1 glycosyltransferase family 2 protein [Patescibacteria group bacterium]MBU1066546.1 glycosyltransferase family 2 protein [Patescibacteria group bacterium]
MTKTKVSIIIPSYNTEWLLEKNIPHVLSAQKNEKNNIIEIIVVDDASPDGSVGLLKKKFPEVKVVQHKINRGFSSSVNTGARTSKGDLLVLLNTDVIPERDFLVSTLPLFKDNNVFAISLSEKDYSWAKGEFKNGFVEHGAGIKTKKVHDTFWVSGGSGVFRRNYWMSLGGMDEKLLSPFYWEDLDLSYRALKRGYKLLWDPDARVLHKHESTIGLLPKKYVGRIRERNQLIFIWKNITSPTLIRKHIIGLSKRTLRHPGYVRIVMMALSKIRWILRARKKEKKDCKVSDEAIFARF